MQRLFTHFPKGPAGVGLLLLRLILTARLSVEAFVAFSVNGTQGSTTHLLVALLLTLCSIVVAAGWLTPIVQLIVAILEIVMAVTTPASPIALFTNPGSAIFAIEAAIAITIALVGPGAYSVDALLFGRRRVIIDAPRSVGSSHQG